jgi:ABC-type dipeptide/oligopeptide/nickel transport system permease subunit
MLRRLRRDRLTILAAAILMALMALASSADFLADNFFQYGFTRQDLLNGYQKPTLSDPAFWLGGDDIGRSQIVRLLYGARVSLSVGIGAAAVNLTIGLTLGLTAGFLRGWFDDLVQFVISTLISIPVVPLLLVVSILFQPSPVSLVIILGLVLWPNVSLFVRGQTLSLREREFVAAGRVSGASNARIILRHIMPNVLPLEELVQDCGLPQIAFARTCPLGVRNLCGIAQQCVQLPLGSFYFARDQNPRERFAGLAQNVVGQRPIAVPGLGRQRFALAR